MFDQSTFLKEAIILVEKFKENIPHLDGQALGTASSSLSDIETILNGTKTFQNGKLISSLLLSLKSCLYLINTGEIKITVEDKDLFFLVADLLRKLLQLLESPQSPPSDLTYAVEISIKSLDAIQKKEADGVWVLNEKLDSFMKLSGELIVLKNYFQVLGQEPELRNLSTKVNRKIADFSYSLNKITDHLQDQIMSIRKVTLERAFKELPTRMNQLAREVNQQVTLKTSGFELGVDRTISNVLNNSLQPIIKYLLSTLPKNIEIRAKEKKGMIYFDILSDGSESKTINSDSFDSEIFGAEIELVKSEILKLKGKARIESFEKKETTFYIEIPVPKTVMVEQTVLVKSQDKFIAVPLNAIAQLTSYSRLSIKVIGNQKTCQFQGKTVPLTTYDELTKSDKTQPQFEAMSVVVLQDKNNFIGLLVDSIHDQLEAVIRPFDKISNEFPGFRGTTILGDDNIAYVVSPEEFVTMGLNHNHAK